MEYGGKICSNKCLVGRYYFYEQTNYIQTHRTDPKPLLICVLCRKMLVKSITAAFKFQESKLCKISFVQAE